MKINEKIDLEKLIDKIQDKRFSFSCKNGIIPNIIILDYRLKSLFEMNGSEYFWGGYFNEDKKDKLLGLDLLTVSEKDYIGVGYIEGI